jgi:hypothetical protein
MNTENSLVELQPIDALQPSAIPDDFKSYLDEQKEQLVDFSRAKVFLKRIVNDWDSEVKQTDIRRSIRDIDVDNESLRKAGKLDEDESLIPDRVIDTNIQREIPPFINYLKNSRRLAIFTCISNPDITDSQRLELEFTRGMTYPNWETPFYKEIDGAATHGWDAMEVVYDTSKPLNVGVEQIGHDKLFFPKSCLDIQDAARIIRAYDVTIEQLKKFVESFSFSREQVGKIIATRSRKNDEPETVRIYKKLCKCDGSVWVGWFSLDHGCDDWLKAPIPLVLGIKEKQITQVQVPTTVMGPLGPEQVMTSQPQESWVDVPVKQYPIFILPYRETEKPRVVDHYGRVFLDKYKQEAMTSILSSFVTGLYRATQVYASRSQDDGTGSSLGEENNVSLVGNRILNKPITFFHSDYPDPMVLKALQYFDVANAAETNQVSFATNNRQDSRKTATEIESSQQQQALLNSVQLTLFSTHIRSIYSLAWMIVQSQAMQSVIKFLLIKIQVPQINPMTKDPVIGLDGQPVMQDQWVNDEEIIKQVYDVRAAGDVDVIQRSEKIQQMKQDWPVISETVLKDAFLAELIRLQYPDSGNKWATILETQGNQFNQMKGLLGAMGKMMAGAITDHPEIMDGLSPEDKNGMLQVVQQSQTLANQEVA